MKRSVIACLLLGGCGSAQPVDAQASTNLASASVVAAAPVNPGPQVTKDGMSAVEKQLAKDTFEALNGLCRGGVTPLDGGEDMAEKLTNYACDQRSAVEDVLLAHNLCYASGWKTCTAQMKADIALSSVGAEKWYIKEGPHPSGDKPTLAFLSGKWIWTDNQTNYIFDNLAAYKREHCPTDAEDFIVASDRVVGWFLHDQDTAKRPTLIIPWTNDVLLLSSLPNEDEEDGQPANLMVGVRC